MLADTPVEGADSGEKSNRNFRAGPARLTFERKARMDVSGFNFT
jgi:hypothetical protein